VSAITELIASQVVRKTADRPSGTTGCSDEIDGDETHLAVGRRRIRALIFPTQPHRGVTQDAIVASTHRPAHHAQLNPSPGDRGRGGPSFSDAILGRVAVPVGHANRRTEEHAEAASSVS
jgi:hypothetical protein